MADVSVQGTRESIEAALPWARLFHAYGPATDTPAHLFALVAGDASAQREAVSHLSSAILHQGTPWLATAPVAEVLVALFRGGNLTTCQPDVLEFLAEVLAISDQVAAATTSREELERQAQSADLDAWLAKTAPIAERDREAAEEAYEALFEDDALAEAFLARAHVECVRVAPIIRAAVAHGPDANAGANR